ncbi:MAG: adenylyl-sulfate reductase subunit alpha [Lachnospiraceae bacterium]
MGTQQIKTDVLIIGGGTAGCYSALTLAENPKINIVIAEKAHIKRSGCLAAGVNAINAYITEGKTPQDYVEYAKKDADGIVREDLLLTAALRFNSVTENLERLGLVILKDENGKYVTRGDRNLKINGENIKPILAAAVERYPNIKVLNKVNIIEYIVNHNIIYGAVGFNMIDKVFYDIRAKAVICTTGGAAGLYRPNNPGFSRHKMWYPPFNTGAGYAMGIRAGAEMTTFEMRFIALRCKDTIAPTGTIAQGVGARQINALSENYENKYGLATSERVYGTVQENLEGRGPCYLKSEGISSIQEEQLLKAYLNMAPSQTLKWIESGKGPGVQNVEIEGTEPYIVGGHTASGYWVDTGRGTTVRGLFAAGDVAGGCPQKYVTGALAEGEIAAQSAEVYIQGKPFRYFDESLSGEIIGRARRFLTQSSGLYTVWQLEEAMQKTMDNYAGGITVHYRYNEKKLRQADEGIDQLTALSNTLHAKDMHELMHIYELKERLTVCKSLIAHLSARKETRWHSFGEHTDYPVKDDGRFNKYINSILKNGKIEIIFRDLVGKGETYEHQN